MINKFNKYILLFIVITFFTIFALSINETCPTKDTFVETWNTWSIDFLNTHPDAGGEEQLDAWNEMMQENGCTEYINPQGNAINLDYEVERSP